ncbi:MAG: Bax inhibitor-1/YccA family protein [Gemmatimonadetes bacterium]|nr:Bax inhibitor-1/YccA family protein [Gemmatimonadota bacterium]
MLTLIHATPLKLGVMLAPLGMGFFFIARVYKMSVVAAQVVVFLFFVRTGINKMSVSASQIFFFIFAVFMGLSFSFIFIAYTGFLIFEVFLTTAIMFAALSLYGYTTKRDLSGYHTFLLMGVIGVVVAMLVNLILNSPALMLAISIVGVLVFSGLTAYDTQRIKSEYLAMAHHGNQVWLEKSALLGALGLYLNYLNIFMFMLLFFGNQE